MPKKRVGVSLRKPSAPERAPKSAQIPAASDASVAATVDTVALEATVHEAAISDAAVSDAAISDAAAHQAAPIDSFQAVALQSSEASQAVEAQSVTSVDAFVNGAAVALQQAASEVPAEKLDTMLERGPEGYRELTIYLPEALAEALSVYCRENGIELSKLVASAVEHHLNAAKTALNAALASNDSVLAVAARSLIGDLRGWVRAVLSTRLRGFRAASAAT